MEKIYLRFAVPALILSSLLLPLKTFADPNTPNTPNTGLASTTTDYNLGKGYGLSGYGLSGWSARIGLNYDQFSNNNTTFAESNTNKIYNIDSDYHAGFNLGLGYRTLKGTDIRLDYDHLRTSDTSNAWAPSLILSPGSRGPVSWARGTNEFSYDTVNIIGGHRVPITDHFGINYGAGLGYARIARDMTVNGWGLGNTINIEAGSSFNGIGPVFDLEAYCEPLDDYPEFSVVGGMTPSLLYGTMTGYVRTDINGVHNSDDIPDDKVVIPGFNYKLGVNYDFTMSGLKLNAQLGYQFTEYLGVTKDSNSYGTGTNASFQGPFFNVGARF